MRKFLAVFMSVGITGATMGTVNAQDIHFSQFYENAILRNPGLTGIFSGDYKAGVNYRTQWSNIGAPFQTVLASAETRIAVNKEVGDYLSFGITATYDHAGSISFNSIQVYPAINFNKAMEDEHNSYLSVGFAGGYIQRSFDVSKMTFSSQFNGGSFEPSNPSGETFTNTTIQNYDLSAGVSFNSSAGAENNVNYYIGAAAYHLTKPKHAFNEGESFIRLNTKWTGNLGIRVKLDDQYALTLHGNYTNQKPYQEWIGGGLVSWRSGGTGPQDFTLYAGVFARYVDALIPTVKMDYQQYSVTVSYDVNTSSLKQATNGVGGFEISLYTRGSYKKTIEAGAQTRCPRFEQMLEGF